MQMAMFRNVSLAIHKFHWCETGMGHDCGSAMRASLRTANPLPRGTFLEISAGKTMPLA